MPQTIFFKLNIERSSQPTLISANETFTNIAKRTALHIVGEALEDIAKGNVKEASKQIVQLGKDLGPLILKTEAHSFFKSLLWCRTGAKQILP